MCESYTEDVDGNSSIPFLMMISLLEFVSHIAFEDRNNDLVVHESAIVDLESYEYDKIFPDHDSSEYSNFHGNPFYR